MKRSNLPGDKTAVLYDLIAGSSLSNTQDKPDNNTFLLSFLLPHSDSGAGIQKLSLSKCRMGGHRYMPFRWASTICKWSRPDCHFCFDVRMVRRPLYLSTSYIVATSTRLVLPITLSRRVAEILPFLTQTIFPKSFIITRSMAAMPK